MTLRSVLGLLLALFVGVVSANTATCKLYKARSDASPVIDGDWVAGPSWNETGLEACTSLAQKMVGRRQMVFDGATRYLTHISNITAGIHNGIGYCNGTRHFTGGYTAGGFGNNGMVTGATVGQCLPTVEKDVGVPSCSVGNPINPTTGNKYQEENDYVGSGAFPLELTRHYNSKSVRTASTMSVGNNWRTRYESFVQFSTTLGWLPSAYVHRPDGRILKFNLSNGQYYPDADISDRLTKLTTSSGVLTGWTYRVCDRDETETYDALGRLVSISDRSGKTQTIGYYPSGKLATVTGPFGHQLGVSYGDGGKFVVITDPDGRDTTFEFDGTEEAYVSEVLADTPVGYWRLQETSGTTAVSSLVGGASGTYGGAYKLGRPGLGNGSVHFDATDDGEVNLGSTANYTAGLTMEVWANPDSTQPDWEPHVFSKSAYYASYRTDIPIQITYRPSTGFVFRIDRGNDFATDVNLSSGVVAPGRWYHIAAVYRQNGQCELWINGVMVASQTINFTISSNSRPWKLANATENNGGRNYSGFNGFLTEAALYSYALPAARVQAHYDAMPVGKLMRVNYPDGTARVYHYEDPAYASHLTGVSYEDANGVATRYSTFSYDSTGRGASTEHAGGAGHFGLSYNSPTETVVTDAKGNQEVLTFASNLGVKNVVSRLNVGLSSSIVQAFDSNNNVVSRTDYNGNVSCFAYDLTRNLELVKVEGFSPGSVCPTDLATYVPTPGTQQRKTSTTWHSAFNLPTQIVEAGRTTNFTHDGSGNVLTRTVTDTATSQSRTWTYTYNGSGQVLTENGPRADVSDVTIYTYYSCTLGFECGQVETVTDAAGHVTTFDSYNAHGQPTQITDPNGSVTTLAYDLRQRLAASCSGGQLPSCTGGELTGVEYWPAGPIKRVTLPGGEQVMYGYDDAHRLTQMGDSAGNSVTYTLDAMGNRTAEDVRDSSSVLRRTHSRVFSTLNRLYQDINASSTGGATTTYGYDNNGNLTSANAPLGRNSSNLFDELNRLMQITDPASGITYLAYDAHDNLIGVTDPNGNATGYAYNGFGELTAQVSPDTGTTTHTYDANGNLATSTDARGGVVTYGYDALNRVTSAAYTLSGSPAQALVYTYDQGTHGKGQLTGAGDTNHALSWTYDAQGRVTGKGLNAGGVVQATGYGYTNGRLTAITLPSGNVLTYTYDAAGQVSSIAMGGTTILSNASWEPFGPVKGWTWGNGSTHSRDHDQDGRVTSLAASIPNGINLGYGYDAASRITSKTDSGTNPVSWSYGYDSLDRLTSAVGPQTQGWSYDANGNRLSETGASPTTYTVSSSSNRLTSTSGTLSRSYGYDAVGNTLSDGTLTLTYDARNRLATAQNGSSTRGYIYDALGQLIEATGTGGTVRYAYDEDGHLIGEYDGTGGLIQETVWLGDIPVATIRPGSSGGYGLFYVHADHLNTPRKLIEPSNNTTVWRWDSDAFGNGTPDQDPDGNSLLVVYNLRFPGQVYDHVTGLNYNYFRDYDPATGRYIESDPIGLGGGTNTYGYVAANPLSFADPRGLFVSSVQAACAVDPSFCLEIMGQMIENAGALSGNACIEQETRSIADGLRALDDVALAAGPIALVKGVAGKAVVRALPTPSVESQKLQNIVNNLYKGTTNPNRIGYGTTADAIRHEAATGQAVGGKFHLRKGRESIRALENWLRGNPNAAYRDRVVAESLLSELRSAVGGGP